MRVPLRTLIIRLRTRLSGEASIHRQKAAFWARRNLLTARNTASATPRAGALSRLRNRSGNLTPLFDLGSRHRLRNFERQVRRAGKECKSRLRKGSADTRRKRARRGRERTLADRGPRYFKWQPPLRGRPPKKLKTDRKLTYAKAQFEKLYSTNTAESQT